MAEHHLTMPISEEAIRALRAGDQVTLTGVCVTGRDAAHKYMLEKLIEGPCPESERAIYDELRAILRGGAIYHCGPIVRKNADGRYAFVSAGPTTSIREEVYEDKVIEHFGVRAIIGKGGMAERTLEACRRFGAVYLHAVGGAGGVVAASVKEVLGVLKMEFGVPEAFWKIRVERFPAVVTMDSHGVSLHEEVLAKSRAALEEMLASGKKK